ncbi:MAG: hypothetical protein AAFV07_12835, partial [Bacteroidota bacterium]
WQIHFQGKPVFHTYLRSHLSQDGEVWRTTCGIPNNPESPTQRVGWPASTADIEASFRAIPKTFKVQTETGWQLDAGRLIPAIKVEQYSWTEIHAEEYTLHVESQDTLGHRALGINWRAPVDTPGTGRVFLPDPCTKGSVAYGTVFTDAMDQHLAVFDSLMDTVVLKDLRFEDGRFHLDGPYVSLRDLAPFSIEPVTSPDGRFFFDRDTSGFEEVMVYFHIDSFQRYVQRLGFTNLQNSPLRVDAHGLGNSDQSTFIPNNGNPYVLFGDGGVDDAEDADVIIHEYIHALSESASSSNNGLERRGLDEGLADYFTAAYSYDLSLWNWYELFNWDGHNEFWSGRMAVSTESYPPNSTGIYGFGQFYASVLMEIRQEIGPEVCDRLVLESMYYNFENMQLPDGAQILLKVDSMLYNGMHLDLLRDKLCARSLLEGADCISVSNTSLARIEGIQARLYTEFLTLKQPTGDPIPSGSQLVLRNINGQVLQTWLAHPQQKEYQLESPLAAGVYILELALPRSGRWVEKLRLY